MRTFPALSPLLAAALLALPLPAGAAPAKATARRIQAEAGFIATGYGICAHAYPDFAGRAAPAWADFRKRYPAAWAHGMRKASQVEELDDRFRPQTDEEEMERLSSCADLLEPGGFDPAREPDPRLATPDGALALLEQALMDDDRSMLLHALMGQARQRVRVAFDTEAHPRTQLGAIIHADRQALAAAAVSPDALAMGVVRGPQAAPTLLIEKVRDEWRVGHL